ncbi:MAG: 16S rRNA (adenine(1518)-N(6)/adenine(1519)-N(6))-dimethyltransferase RsmA [Candidatus Cloacimonetes bacterium]|jgi:16S rRNA (adenine1518-N6/adenine1519-N6)-dimethyltransferase|nr:16S rRNA (adenine(1518)-N(6)/adenine(1519)-N(6))-dimethyltransferase RsmA [Candidatus Cloacimonadota bacterium]MDY0337677.1 16S rRNA (adenine(1518)-N(6)/adenine(1519)-N(6))-dimethyltransferase RsmA [Candidatus Cloacimonadaceae bacterium]
MKAIKDLGQHFLNNSDIALSIADLANLEPGETVWEIGPGTGILSAELIKRQVMLSAFELDKRMAEILHQRFSHNFRLVLRDILKVNWAEELAQAPNPIKLVANIPYQITSPLLYKLEEYSSHFSRIVLMVQKEVAERLSASPGTKSYGLMTLRLALKYDTQIKLMVGKEHFDPIPKVDSAVVLMLPRKKPADITHPELYHKLITASFAHRRKTLRNNLLPLIGRQKIKDLETSCEIDLGRRAETLYEADFIRLSNLVADLL